MTTPSVAPMGCHSVASAYAIVTKRPTSGRSTPWTVSLTG